MYIVTRYRLNVCDIGVRFPATDVSSPDYPDRFWNPLSKFSPRGKMTRQNRTLTYIQHQECMELYLHHLIQT